MHQYLKQILRESLKNFDLDSIPEIQIEKPRIPEHGDAATNIAMILAKPLRNNPRKIAGQIVDSLNFDKNIVESAEVAGPGFINFRFTEGYFFRELAKIIRNQKSYGKSSANESQSFLVEFVSANPTGPLTVGHGRNAVLGDTIARLIEWTGGNVDREYYFNNAGRQMRLLGESVRTRYLQELGENTELPESGYEGAYITQIARQINEEYGDEAEKISDNSTLFKERAEKAIFEDIEATLERMNIEMDSFFNEQTLYDNGSLDETVKQLKAKNLAYDADGAIWFKTTNFGKAKDTVLIKSSGEPTYRLPDIAYHVNKLERGYDTCIDLFGADHIDTYPDVISGVKALGYPAEKIEVVIYQFVTLVKDGKPYKMSTRKANFVTLDELMDEVGSDVTRFFFLMRAPSTHLEFDIGEAKEAGEKNPVFYLQYAHARIQSILRKIDEKKLDHTKTDLSLLTHENELALIKTLVDFPSIISSAAEAREPHRLITYLNDVASAFTSFYHECRIIGVEENLMIARALLAVATVTVLRNGLTILGISAPDSM